MYGSHLFAEEYTPEGENLMPEQSIYNTTYTYDFYDVGTYLDCSVGCYFGVVGSSKPIYWSATTQVTIPKL